VSDAAAIVLAGGRSSRMGSPKAALEWHGSTLLRRVTGLLARAVDGPVVVVRAPGQVLPELAPTVEIVADPVQGRGPLQGLAAGLAALTDWATAAYVCSTDVPLLHPAFVRRVLSALGPTVDVALPELGGFAQPLSAAYRVALAPEVQALVAAGRRRPGDLFERCRVRRLDAASMLADPWLARVDPQLASISNLNAPEDYARARALPAPEIEVALGPGAPEPPRHIGAWTLGELAAALGVALHPGGTRIALHGEPIELDPELPLVAGDALAVSV